MANGGLINFAQALNNPNRFAPSMGDPFAELTKLVSQMGQSSPYTPPQPSTLDQFLTAIQQALITVSSRDPGATAVGFLGQEAERKQEQERFKQARANKLEDVTLQTAIERARNLSLEQSEFKKEQRQNIFDKQKSARELDIYGRKKDIDLKEAENTFRLNQNLLAEYEPVLQARELNKVITADWPQQRKDSVEWQAIARVELPNLDPVTAKVIGDKLSGLNKEPLTPEETDLVKKVNQAVAKTVTEERKAKLGKIRAETTRELAEAAYTRMGKPGQDRYLNAINARTGQEVVEELDTQYFRLQSGEILSGNQVRQLTPLEAMKQRPQPLSPEENLQQQQKALEKLNRLRLEQNKNITTQPTPTQLPGGQAKTDEQVSDAIRIYRSRQYTDEQIKLALRTSGGVTEDQMNRLLGTKPASPTPTNSPRPRKIFDATPEQQRMADEIMKALEKEKQRRKK